MLPGSSGEFLRKCVKDPNAVKLEKQRGVHWLPCSATEHMDGPPLCPNPRTASVTVEAPPISVPDPDATPMQLEESEGNTWTKTQSTASEREQGRVRCTSAHAPPISVVVRSLQAKQWLTRTDQGLTRTEVKPRWVWTTSWRGRRTLSMRRRY